MKYFLIGCDVWRKVDFIWQPVTTSSVVGLRRSPKALPKAKLAPKKEVMVTVWWSAACLIHYSFLNPTKTITSEKYAQQIGVVRWKVQCLQLALVNRKGSILHGSTQLHVTQTQRFKSWMNWAKKFCLIRHIHLTSRQPTTTSSSISTTFCRENASTTSRRQKMLSKSSSNPEAWVFPLQE